MRKREKIAGIALLAGMITLLVATWYQTKMTEVEPLPVWAYDYLHNRAVPNWVERVVLDHLEVRLESLKPRLTEWVTVYRSKQGWLKRIKVRVSIVHPFQPTWTWYDRRDGEVRDYLTSACLELPERTVAVGGETYYSRPQTTCHWLESHFQQVIRTVYPR